MVTSTAPISSELALICELLAGCKTDDGIVIPRTKVDPLMRRIHLLREAARSMEHELGAHRIGRANNAAAGVIEDLATDALRDGLIEGSGAVVRPKFGGKRR